jgi:hypothetical protein
MINDCFNAGIAVFFSSKARRLTLRGGFADFEERFSITSSTLGAAV